MTQLLPLLRVEVKLSSYDPGPGCTSISLICLYRESRPKVGICILLSLWILSDTSYDPGPGFLSAEKFGSYLSPNEILGLGLFLGIGLLSYAPGPGTLNCGSLLEVCLLLMEGFGPSPTVLLISYDPGPTIELLRERSLCSLPNDHFEFV